jgi:selenocysteine lyase/cysteine desulfurase
MSTYQHLFTQSLASYKKLHFAAHSHHFWPDCGFEAYKQHWADSITMADSKWQHIFENVLTESKSHIASHLGLSNPDQIALAPNTHEFSERILSCFVGKKKVRVLSTDQEFYSFLRQAERYAELPEFEFDWVQVEPIENFENKLIQKIKSQTYDLIFLSQVFFTSGFELPNLEKIVDAVNSPETTIVIDGYHAFFAIPTNLKKIEDRIFYMAGSYKYAMSGEGLCFLHIPKGCQLRPLNTGWFAERDFLEKRDARKKVYYADNFLRFAGSTFDPIPAYRFNAVMRMLKKEGITIETRAEFIHNLKVYFIKQIEMLDHPNLSTENIMRASGEIPRANFITFKTAKAGQLCAAMNAANLYTDFRNDRLRFGFGLYHTREMIDQCIEIIKKIKI